MLDIGGLDKAEVLMALYNRARTHGNGFMRYEPKPMTVEEARAIIAANPFLSFDYVKGRVLKVDLRGNEVDTRLYNRDNGPEAAEDALLDYLTAPKQE